MAVLFIPTENIIRGMLNKSTITLPIEKFVLFNKFIEAEIEPKHLYQYQQMNTDYLLPLNIF